MPPSIFSCSGHIDMYDFYTNKTPETSSPDSLPSRLQAISALDEFIQRATRSAFDELMESGHEYLFAERMSDLLIASSKAILQIFNGAALDSSEKFWASLILAHSGSLAPADYLCGIIEAEAEPKIALASNALMKIDIRRATTAIINRLGQIPLDSMMTIEAMLTLLVVNKQNIPSRLLERFSSGHMTWGIDQILNEYRIQNIFY